MNSLTRLVVDNFQSHEHSEIILGPGLNVIVGPSDFGKSALVRALRWLFYNEPRGANFIRVGARTCKVSVELEDGSRIARLRDTSGRNQYTLQRPGEDEKVFGKAGSEIPQEVIMASGIKKVLVDENNQIELNFGAQLDGPFLLTENGAVRAKVIGQLGGVHILDWAQKSAGTDLRRLREDEGRLAAEISRLELELASYAYLRELEAGITSLEGISARAEAITGDIAALEGLQRQWEEVSARLEQLDLIVAALERLDRAEAQAGNIELKAQQYQNLVGIASEQAQVDRQLAAATARLTALAGLDEAESRLFRLEAVFADCDRTVLLAGEIRQTRALLEQAARIAAKTEAVPVAGSYCEEAEQLYQQWLELNRVCSELAGVMAALKGAAGTAERTRQLEQIAGSLEAAAETWQRLSAYREIWQNWQERERLCQGANLAAERYQHELKQALSAYGRLLAQIGRCPVCFGELTEEAVRRALAEYE